MDSTEEKMAKRTTPPKKKDEVLVVSVFAPKTQWTALRAEVRERGGKVVKTVKQTTLQEEVYGSEPLAKFLEEVARVIRDENLV
jgi:hypothetical protein